MNHLLDMDGYKNDAKQLQIIDALCNMQQAVAKLVLEGRSWGADRQQRTVNPTRRELVQSVYMRCGILLSTYEDAGPIDDIFRESNVGFAGMLSSENITSMVGTANALCDEIVKTWELDATDICDLLAGWTPPGWQCKRDSIMEAGGKDVRDLLITNAHYSQMTKAVDLIEEWKKQLKAINNIGCGAKVSPDVLKKITSSIADGRETLSFTYALYVFVVQVFGLDPRSLFTALSGPGRSEPGSGRPGQSRNSNLFF